MGTGTGRLLRSGRLSPPRDDDPPTPLPLEHRRWHWHWHEDEVWQNRLMMIMMMIMRRRRRRRRRRKLLVELLPDVGHKSLLLRGIVVIAVGQSRDSTARICRGIRRLRIRRVRELMRVPSWCVRETEHVVRVDGP